jgi:hypothetical protein
VGGGALILKVHEDIEEEDDDNDNEGQRFAFFIIW